VVADGLGAAEPHRVRRHLPGDVLGEQVDQGVDVLGLEGGHVAVEHAAQDLGPRP
jgi:hypothetical protein